MAQFDLIDDSEEMEQAGTVDVLIPLGLDQAYSYAVPAGLVLKPGDVVQVPLGPRETVGVVWDVGSGRGGNLKKVTEKYDMPPLDPALRKLVDWVAWYTLAPKGSVLALALRRQPDDTPERPKLGVRLAGAPPGRMTPARARAIAAAEGGLLIAKSALAEAASVSAAVIDSLVDAGTFIVEPMPRLNFRKGRRRLRRRWSNRCRPRLSASRSSKASPARARPRSSSRRSPRRSGSAGRASS